MSDDKRNSLSLEEKIIIKPSTELIADEYERTSNKSVPVYIFYSREEYNQESAKYFEDSLKRLKYEQCNVYDIEAIDMDETLDGIIEKLKNEKPDALIFFFASMFKYDGTMMVKSEQKVTDWNIDRVWKRFTTYNCSFLKDVPKIFIYQVSRFVSTVQKDGRIYIPKEAYDAPAEADMLIIFNRTENEDIDARIDFVQQFCENINLFGKSEDIISLATCTENFDDEGSRPLIISTFTRKFYLTIENARGHHLAITENTQMLTETLNVLNKKLSILTESKPKSKSRWSFNFKKNLLPSTVEKNKKKTALETSIPDKSTSEKLAPEKPARSNPSRRSSTISREIKPSTVIDGGTARKRNNSVSEGQKKPWRY